AERALRVGERVIVLAFALAQARARRVEDAEDLVLLRQLAGERLGDVGPAIALGVLGLARTGGDDEVGRRARRRLLVTSGERRQVGALEDARRLGEVALEAHEVPDAEVGLGFDGRVLQLLRLGERAAPEAQPFVVLRGQLERVGAGQLRADLVDAMGGGRIARWRDRRAQR